MKVDWTRGACRISDPELFFRVDDEDHAVAICGVCPIRLECLNHALNKPERFGVWGGTTESERRRFGWRKHRVRCPGCASGNIDWSTPRVEVCRACGLSWPV